MRRQQSGRRYRQENSRDLQAGAEVEEVVVEEEAGAEVKPRSMPPVLTH